MAIGKQTLKYFFGATNTDSSKKGVRIGDLLEASNVRQLNAGEYVQRGGLLASPPQTYDEYRGGNLVPISISNPSGVHTITRASDGRAWSSVDGANHRFIGQLPNILADVSVKSTAGESGENEAPLAKRAGQYSVHFVKAGYFEVTKSDVDGLAIVERHRVSMQAGNSAVSNGCKSLALISSDDFDDSALWVLWVDWRAGGSSKNPGAIYSRRIPYSDLTGGSAYVAHEFTDSGSTRGIYLTSISASVVGANECAVAVCGFRSELGGEPVTWWETNDGNLWQGRAATTHFYLNKSTGQAKTSPAPFDRLSADDTPFVGSGCCILTAKGVHEHHSGHWFYAYWSGLGMTTLEAPSLVVVDVTGSNLTYSARTHDGESRTEPVHFPIYPPLNGATFTWHWLGSITGHETASGVDLVTSMRSFWYYVPQGETVAIPSPSGPDNVRTYRITLTDNGTWETVWTARASWLACGYFRDPNNSEDLFVSGYCDQDATLPTYHLRRYTDGSIVAQVAYGQAAFPGGCGAPSTQTTEFFSDVQQPMLYGGATKHVVLGLMSDNTSQSVDVAEVELSNPSTWQTPAVVGKEVFSPGPMVNVCGGWQTLREAIPLLSPSRPYCYYWDQYRYGQPITDGTVAIAIVYRFVYSNGDESKIARSAPYILPNALRLTGASNTDDFIRVPTLRHITGSVNPAQFDALSVAMAEAQIELYLDFGDATLALWGVYDNDPTADYVEVYPTSYGDGYVTLAEAIAAHAPGEALYTAGDALENSPPPMARAVCEWRNRLFAGYKNTITPTQEFSTGLSPQWNDTLSSTWADGTGGIVAVCPIDYNYLAVFKQDAIGIISGPGPDGLGRGAYIVQTIPTSKGVTNPRSVINGADGCYFQEAATGRLCLLNAQLQIVECAPGAWHLSSQPISAALNVESERQVWFATESAKIIVLDYKHKTETCPFGSVYTWDATTIGYPRAMCIVNGVPKFSRQSGALGYYSTSTGYDADLSPVVNKTDIQMVIETGELQLDSLQGEFALSRLAIIGEFVAPHSLTITTYPNYSATGESRSVSVLAGPEQFVTRPPNCMRTESVRVRLMSLSSGAVGGVTVYGGALKFIGFALEVQPHGRIAWQPTSRVI